MSAIGVDVLVGAGAGDDGNAVGFAYIYCGGGDTGHTGSETGLGAHHAVHPNMLHAQVHALTDDLFGHFGVGEDEDCIWLGGQRLGRGNRRRLGTMRCAD